MAEISLYVGYGVLFFTFIVFAFILNESRNTPRNTPKNFGASNVCSSCLNDLSENYFATFYTQGDIISLIAYCQSCFAEMAGQEMVNKIKEKGESCKLNLSDFDDA